MRTGDDSDEARAASPGRGSPGRMIARAIGYLAVVAIAAAFVAGLVMVVAGAFDVADSMVHPVADDSPDSSESPDTPAPAPAPTSDDSPNSPDSPASPASPGSPGSSS